MAEARMLDIVMVEIGEGLFAFPASEVREALPMVEPTPMPDWPGDALGLVNVRGELMPLMDLSRHLGRPPLMPSARYLILTLMTRERVWGALVNRVEGVVNAAIRSMDGARKEGQLAPGVCAGLILWVQGPVVLLDPEALATLLHVPDMRLPDASAER